MKKKIFITNGMARSGKDTFAKFMNEFVPTKKYSSIDVVKEYMRLLGIEGEKTESYRKLLSDMKYALSNYDDIPFKSIQKEIDKFLNSDDQVMLIDIREPKEIERACKEFGAKSIFIVNNRVKNVTSNSADANVYNYNYDYIIENNGTLDDFKNETKKFYVSNVMEG